MTQSKDQQVKVVVVGMALGVLPQGVEAVTSKKMALEFAFNYAWRRWSQSRRFPRIGGHNPGNMVWICLGQSGRRQGVIAAWAANQWCAPYLTQDWSVEAALEHHSDAEVSAKDWAELGRLFVEYFKPEEVRRAP